MNSANFLAKFIGSGFFPKELPPPFSSHALSHNLAVVGAAWVGDGRSAPTTRADIFTIPRHGRHRRRLSTPNPVSQFYLAKAISENWSTLASHIEKSPITLFKTARSSAATRVFEPIDFSDIEARKNSILSRCDSALMADISRYYPTIYTHSIAWALHGKEYCKKHLHDKASKALLGNLLDDLVRKGQDSQSLGIPLGPDTSIVVSEIIGSAIDRLVCKALKLDDETAFRYTDDFYIGLREGRTPEKVHSQISSALSVYELELANEKTRIVASGARADPDWALEISQFRLPVEARRKRKAIDYYFKRAFHLAQANPTQNVLSYVVSRSRAFNIDRENWESYEEFILQCGRANSTTIELIVRILIDADKDDMPLNRKWIEVFISDLLLKNSALEHHWEVCWLLFLSRELRIELPEPIIDSCQRVESSAIGLLLLDLGSRDLARVGGLKHRLVNGITASDFQTGEWLVLYEGARQGWLGKDAREAVLSDKYLGTLIRNDIKFYLEKKSVPRIDKERLSPAGASYDPAYFRF